MEVFLPFLPGVVIVLWAVADRRPLTFAAAAVALFLGAAATPIVLRARYPLYELHFDDADEVVMFALMAGFPALLVGATALLSAKWRGNGHLSGLVGATYLLLLGLNVCWVMVMGVMWGM